MWQGQHADLRIPVPGLSSDTAVNLTDFTYNPTNNVTISNDFRKIQVACGTQKVKDMLILKQNFHFTPQLKSITIYIPRLNTDIKWTRLPTNTNKGNYTETQLTQLPQTP